MIRRAAVVVMVGLVTWLVVAVGPAGGEAPTDQARTVSVDLPADIGPQLERGILVRTESPSPAPMLAVGLSLFVIGATLTAITVRRRALSPQALEFVIGAEAGRRTDRWGVPATPGTPS